MLLAQQGRKLAHAQREQHAAIIQGKPVKTGQQTMPMRRQFISQSLNVRTAVCDCKQIAQGRWLVGERHVMQHWRPARIALPGLPGSQEIKACTETGVKNLTRIVCTPKYRWWARTQHIGTSRENLRLKNQAAGGT